jgi:YD repeat-containing protein
LKINKKCIIGLFLCLLPLLNVQAENITTKQRLESHIQSLNELTERRRVNTFFNNDQPIQYGLKKGYVNTSRGNLTFTRRDMVVVGRVPIIAARVYDSSRSDSADFSPGWYLSLAETITNGQNGSLIYTDGSSAVTLLAPSTIGYVPAQGEVTDITNVVKTNNQLQVNYHSGWQKHFALVADRYRLIAVNDAYGNEIKLDYTNNKISRIVGHNGRAITFERNEVGQITKINDESYRTVSYSYNKKRQLDSVTDLAGNRWHYQYFGKGQLKKVTDPQGNSAGSFKYDSHGRVKFATIRGLSNYYTYSQNRTTVTDAINNDTVFDFNLQGITTSVISALGQTSKIILDKNNQVTKLSHNGQLTAESTYSTNRKLKTLNRRKADDNFELLTYSYDNAERLISINHKNTVLKQSTFNAQGLPLRLVANGIERTYSYNDRGDIISQHEGEVSRSFNYNLDGLLTEYTKDGNKATFNYSKIGRLMDVTFPDGTIHRYQYDALGFRKQTIRSDESATFYSYNSTGSLEGLSHTDTQGNMQHRDIVIDENSLTKQFIIDGHHALDVTYADGGNPTTIVYGDTKTVNYSYDKLNRLIKVDAGQDDVLTYQYKDDENDLRIQMDERTSKVTTSQHKSSSNLLNTESLYTRSTGAAWQHIIWNESIGRIMLLNTEGYISPDSNFVSSIQRRFLSKSLAKTKHKRNGFDKPSNSFFLAAEYLVDNCEPQLCGLWSLVFTGPSDVIAGDNNAFYEATALVLPDWLCEPNYSFKVDNTNIYVANRTGELKYSFPPGEHNVGVTAVCGYCPLNGIQSQSIDLCATPTSALSFNTLNGACPNRKQNKRQHEFDGCTWSPDDLEAWDNQPWVQNYDKYVTNPVWGTVINGGNGVNDATAANQTLACNVHDRDWQTCDKNESVANAALGDGITASCAIGYPLDCPYDNDDEECREYDKEREACEAIGPFYVGVVTDFNAAYKERQTQYCSCCGGDAL